MKRLLLALTLMSTTGAVLVSGCTKSEPPRSFVQPNALRKADFTGTWYYNATVIDAPPTNGAVYEGQYGELEKIKWVLSEDTLFAVRSYPFVYNQENPQTPGSVAGNVDGSDTYEGEPLGAWHITSYFDIIRDYNPSTGEETNRIIESQERPWNEREYFRVDWSKNVAPDYTGLGLDFLFSGVDVTELSYYVSDPTSPYALHIERADDADATDFGFTSGDMNYLDFTDEVILQPNEQEFVIDDQGNTMKLPSCFAYYGSEDCAAQKAKIRHAFARQHPNETYEKRKWDGVDQNLFGFFTTELRHTWDPKLGDMYSGDKRYAERFNFFDKSCNTPGTSCEAPHRIHDLLDASWVTNFTDADVPTADQNGVTPSGKRLSASVAVCENLIPGKCIFVGGAQIGVPAANTPDSVYYLEGTDGVAASQDSNWIPPANRTIKTIPYYANEDMPEDIWQDSKEVIREWNTVFQTAATDQVGTPVTTDIFVWCHNPVHSDDPAPCAKHLKPDVDANGNVVNGADGNPVYRVRQGDPRYSSILWLGEYQAGGPLGLGPALSDPETGETISAKANIYGGDLLTYASYARDLIGLMNGDITPDQYVNGANLSSWVKAEKTSTGVASLPRGFTDDEKMAAVQKMDFTWARGLAPGKIDTSSLKAMKQSMADRESHMLEAGTFGNGATDPMETMLGRLKGTPLESTLLNGELASAVGLDPNVDFASLTAEQKQAYSPLNSPYLRLARQQAMERMEAFGYDFEPISYDVIEGEAQRYKGQHLSDAMWTELRDRIYIAVTLHEVGHNMGLRHNFRGSFDAMNYFPDYWKQRELAANTDHPADTYQAPGGTAAHPHLFARSNVHGTWLPSELAPVAVTKSPWTGFDPGLVSEFGLQYSSIMDYGAAFNTDTAGLGRYDAAAIKYGYANNVEVFTDADTSDPKKLWRLSSLQTFQDAYGFPSALLDTGAYYEAVNYFTFPELMKNGPDSLQQRKDVSAYAVNSVYINVPSPIGGAGTDEAVEAASDAQGNLLPRVPYFFCSDEFVGNLSCQRFDFGADAYEQAYDIIHRYQNYYVLRNFKRDSYSFHSGPHYVDYTLERYFEILREQMTWYTLLRADFEDSNHLFGNTNVQLDQFLADDTLGWGSFSLAIDQSFKMFGQVLTEPQAGSFVQSTDDNGDEMWKQFRDDVGLFNLETDGVLSVDVTDGRYEGTSWNFSGCGYYWGDECQTRIGYFLDKYLALYTLAESQAYFTGRDTALDVRRYAIGYYLPYKAQLLQSYGALLSGDTLSLAPVFHGGAPANEPAVEMPDFTAGTAASFDTSAASLDKHVDPEIGFSLQMWAGVFSMAGFSSTFDHGFLDASRIFVVGNGEAPVPDSALLDSSGAAGPQASFNPADLVANGGTKAWLLFTDTYSGLTYAARSVPQLTIPNGTGGGVAVRQDVGARMLEHAQSLLSDTQNGSFDQFTAKNNYNLYIQNLDMMRALHAAYGYGPYSTDQ